MFNVINHLQVGNNLAVTLNGVCNVNAGSKIKDEYGNIFEIVSVGMARYNNPDDINQFTDVLLSPNKDIGKELFLI